MISNEEFARWLRFGFRRAVLHVMQHDATPYRDIILDACLHNLALDRQSEGNRAVYMYDIISRTPDFEFYSNALLGKLPEHFAADHDTWYENDYDIAQVYHLAARLAYHGNARAREILYQQFEANPEYGDFLIADAIIDMDGLDGFLRIAARLNNVILSQAERFEENPNEWFGIRTLLFELARYIEESEFSALFARLRTERPALIPFVDIIERDWDKMNERIARPPKKRSKPRVVSPYEEIFERGDWKEITALIEGEQDEEELHGMGFSAYHLFDASASLDALPTLLDLYERNRCAVCRERVVERLHQLNQIPDWMREECAYDSNRDLRKAIKNNFA